MLLDFYEYTAQAYTFLKNSKYEQPFAVTGTRLIKIQVLAHWNFKFLTAFYTFFILLQFTYKKRPISKFLCVKMAV